MSASRSNADHGVPFSEAVKVWARVAALSFGGPAGQIAVMHRIVVEEKKWIGEQRFLQALNYCTLLPGPLIMVTQFVGFLAAWREPGALHPLLAATLGGLLTTWVTFTPCFLWIFFGAPFVEALRANKALSAALATITAAVVGVILNLAVWFGLQVLFAELKPARFLGAAVDLPVLASANLPAIALATACAVAVFRLKFGMIPVLLAAALAGVVYALVLSA